MAKTNSKRKKSTKKSFKRAYREDLKRDLNVPGIGEHIVKSFSIIFKNWKLFLPLLVIGILILVLTIGVTDIFKETAGVFAVVVFLLLWLTTIFLLRQVMAGNKVGVRDGLYNAMAPSVATFVIFAVVAVECIPIFLLVVAYSAAIQTEFLAMPFYSLLFWAFAALMVLISGYLLPTSIIALLAITVPGTYPFRALVMASEIVEGRKIKIIIRIVALVLVLGIIWAALLLPISALKLPPTALSVMIIILTCFSTIYAAAYLFMYYRWILDYSIKEEKKK